MAEQAFNSNCHHRVGPLPSLCPGSHTSSMQSLLSDTNKVLDTLDSVTPRCSISEKHRKHCCGGIAAILYQSGFPTLLKTPFPSRLRALEGNLHPSLQVYLSQRWPLLTKVRLYHTCNTHIQYMYLLNGDYNLKMNIFCV